MSLVESLFSWLMSRSSPLGFAHLNQFLEQRAVRDQRPTEVLGRSGLSRMPFRDAVRITVVLHDLWMIDGQIFRAAVEVGHRIATNAHQLSYQGVGFGDGYRRIVDE